METKLLKSILTLAAVAVVGLGITYAQFVSGPVTIAASSATTGTAEIQLCNADGDDTWKDTVNPNLSLNGLIPGGEAKELTENSNIYLGNDNGDLGSLGVEDHDGISGNCTNGSDGTSVAIQQITPHVNNVSCVNSANESLEALEDQFKISFQLEGGTATEFKSLSYWKGDTSADVLSPELNPGQAKLVTVKAELSDQASEQNATCTFDMMFNGQQP